MRRHLTGFPLKLYARLQDPIFPSFEREIFSKMKKEIVPNAKDAAKIQFD